MPHPHSLSLEANTSATDYSNLAVQEAFMMLPKDDQIALKNLHHSQANILNGPETIEIAGMRILGKPIEMIRMTGNQKQTFKAAGGLIDPTPEQAKDPENQSKMMYWETDYNLISGHIDGVSYIGFSLFQKLCPEYNHLSEDEARSQGLMTRYDRNHWAREDFTQKMGGRQATRAEQKRIITEASALAKKKNPNAKNPEILSEMGQKLLGWRNAASGEFYCVGEGSNVASSDIDVGEVVRGLDLYRHESHSRDNLTKLRTSLSSVVVMDNGTK